VCREAEMAVPTLGLITDNDCCKSAEAPVSAEAVVSHLHANAAAARAILPGVIARIPRTADWPEHRILDSALLTARPLWPAATLEKLRPILARLEG
jgi:5'-methylthioadenosine phosphorylase